MAIPEKVDRYEIQGEIDRGGMATVFRAYDPRFQRTVADQTVATANDARSSI